MRRLPAMPYFLTRTLTLTLIFTLTALVFTTVPAAADWLITLEGRMIETDGTWTVEDGTILYTTPDGEAAEIALAEVDLEGSERTTALRQGRDFKPSEALLRLRAAEQAAASAPPRVTVYSRWRCGRCEDAKSLLDRLGVRYREVFEEDRAARKKLHKLVQKKAYILPVLDIGGKVVIGYRPEEIERWVEELGKAPAEEDEETDEETEGRTDGEK